MLVLLSHILVLSVLLLLPSVNSFSLFSNLNRRQTAFGVQSLRVNWSMKSAGDDATGQVQPPSKGKYCLNVTLCVKPERHEEFIRYIWSHYQLLLVSVSCLKLDECPCVASSIASSCIKANQAGTLSTEPKARQYVFGRSTAEPNVFHFHEEYDDEDGFVHHTQTPHFAAWEAFAASDPFLRPPEVVFFTEVTAE